MSMRRNSRQKLLGFVAETSIDLDVRGGVKAGRRKRKGEEKDARHGVKAGARKRKEEEKNERERNQKRSNHPLAKEASF